MSATDRRLEDALGVLGAGYRSREGWQRRVWSQLDGRARVRAWPQMSWRPLLALALLVLAVGGLRSVIALGSDSGESAAASELLAMRAELDSFEAEIAHHEERIDRLVDERYRSYDRLLAASTDADKSAAQWTLIGKKDEFARERRELMRLRAVAQRTKARLKGERYQPSCRGRGSVCGI